MMIELIVLKHLENKLSVPVSLEKLSAQTESYVVFEKTSSGKSNHLPSATIAFQSYADSLYNAVELNEKVKTAVESLIELDEIRGLTLNSDYNFTDTTTKEYRYQAVYDIRYY
uniref:Tail completion protein n=1 Tax=Siphoviridae sp. ctwrX9 TaxID=2825735 RepID=A0A8S5PVP5_9CAUD|nr:MAG TPA: tail completion protein [Siphoviridae sp. ctwrX9]